MSKKFVFTIGYEGCELADFLATLKACEIELIIDVRDVPLSRKRGFSKTALETALKAKGIAYRHLKDLGDPKPGREAARQGNMPLFKKLYSQHLESAAAKAALKLAGELALSSASCLLCFERSNSGCHRSMIADKLAESCLFDIRHIGVKSGIDRQNKYKHGQAAGEFAIG